jgi:cation-transporting P-type ATPase F
MTANGAPSGAEPEVTDWHSLSIDEAVTALAANAEHGLSQDEAARRAASHGPNLLPEAPRRPAWRRLLEQFLQPLVFILLLAALVTSSLGEWIDAAVIFGVIAVNAAIGYLQEGRAEQALRALMATLASEVTVLREDVRLRLPARALVPGDLVLLAAGDKVPADLRLLRCRSVRVDEAALTGESLPVDKHVEALPADAQLAERGNMAFGGSTVLTGACCGLVVATGAASETGKIARAIAEAPTLSTPLTRHLATFARRLLWVIGGLAAITFAVGTARGEAAYDMFMAAVALAVGAIPEGLPAALTVSLAIGVARMARRRAVIRRMPAVETLGSTTVICTDKTGTLTENAMTVREIYVGGQSLVVTGHGYAPEGGISVRGETARMPTEGALRELLVAGVLCNDAGLRHSNRQWTITGDPTEATLLVLARKAGLDEETLRRALPRRDELPFASEVQAMATLHEVEGQHMIYLKGASEKVLARCDELLTVRNRGQTARRPLAGALREEIDAVAASMAERGLRVLALAHAPSTHDKLPALPERGMIFLGLVGMIDPPRAAAAGAVRSCRNAGIAVKMVTGDHAVTALAIARQLGIAGPDEVAVSGRELAAYDDLALQEVVKRSNVFARVEPAQKLRLVRALQANGEVVGMTGDGVNDAPALRSANIGIAMGHGGTEVAKEAADMVLTDDNFATIEAAVEEGRGVYDNIVKFITWTLPTNFGEGLVILAAVFAGVALPITPLQILWINMTTAVLLGMTLAFEPVEKDVMRRPPRSPGAPLLDTALAVRIVLVSVLLLIGAFGMFLWYQQRGASLAESRTMAMNVFVMTEAVYLLNCRSLRQSLVGVGVWSNRWVWAGMAVMLALQLLMTYLPAMNAAFDSAPISALAWGEIFAFACFVSAVIALEKRFWQRGKHAEFGSPAGQAG